MADDHRQVENLVMAMEHLTLCKESIIVLNSRLNTALATLLVKESTLAGIEARMRRAEEEMAKILAAC